MVRDWLTVLAVPCGSVILTAPAEDPRSRQSRPCLAPDHRAMHPILAGQLDRADATRIRTSISTPKLPLSGSHSGDGTDVDELGVVMR
jgi:hypothetical protein